MSGQWKYWYPGHGWDDKKQVPVLAYDEPEMASTILQAARKKGLECSISIGEVLASDAFYLICERLTGLVFQSELKGIDILKHLWLVLAPPFCKAEIQSLGSCFAQVSKRDGETRRPHQKFGDYWAPVAAYLHPCLGFTSQKECLAAYKEYRYIVHPDIYMQMVETREANSLTASIEPTGQLGNPVLLNQWTGRRWCIFTPPNVDFFEYFDEDLMTEIDPIDPI